DTAQVQVQNRVAIAEPRLPESARRLGITTKKVSPNMLMVINLFSPNKSYDQTYMGNYAVLQIKDELARIKGIGDVQLFGAAEYAMRSEEHTSELQSRENLVCRLLLEK